MNPMEQALPAIAPHASGRDWEGYGHAALHTAYALLVALTMLLPANFVAFALTTTLAHGGALAGARYAAAHHLVGYWMAADSTATPVGAGLWWASAAWECLFWASCASALLLCLLWVARAVLGHWHPRAASALQSQPVRAA